MAEFMQTNAVVIDQMEKYLSFLENDLLPRSHGNFAVGEAGIQAILDAEEMIDVPVKDILKRCYQDLEKTEMEISDVAYQIDPTAAKEELIVRMRADHSAPEDIHHVIREELARVRSYLTEYDLVTIPPEMPHVIVTPMPDYASGGGMMLTPGPFETVAEESYLALQIPKPDWTQAQVDGLWSDFNTYALPLLMIHECYPGHHTQFYLEKRLRMFASKDHDSDSNSDGWAEFGKYMMVDRIYRPKKSILPAGSPAFKTQLHCSGHCRDGDSPADQDPPGGIRFPHGKAGTHPPEYLHLGVEPGNSLPHPSHLLYRQ